MTINWEQVINNITIVNKEVGQEAQAHINNLTKPLGSLGDLERVAVTIAEITGEKFPDIFPPGVIVFAADHGVAEEGVSAYPQEVTAQMALNILQNGAGINVFTNAINGLIRLVDVGIKSDLQAEGMIVDKIAYGTKNFAKEEAMSREEAIRSIEVGMKAAKEIIESGAKLLIVGELGIANTTASSAVVAAITKRDVASLVGQGTGVVNEALAHKIAVVEQALQLHKPDQEDGLDILQKVGGFEIGAMAGAMLYAASRKVPILLDGFICTASALIASKLSQHVSEYMIGGHQSVEPGHTAALATLGKKPLIALELRLGEGTGAAIAYPIVQSAVKMIREMATFETANISKG